MVGKNLWAPQRPTTARPWGGTHPSTQMRPAGSACLDLFSAPHSWENQNQRRQGRACSRWRLFTLATLGPRCCE